MQCEHLCTILCKPLFIGLGLCSCEHSVENRRKSILTFRTLCICSAIQSYKITIKSEEESQTCTTTCKSAASFYVKCHLLARHDMHATEIFGIQPSCKRYVERIEIKTLKQLSDVLETNSLTLKKVLTFFPEIFP